MVEGDLVVNKKEAVPAASFFYVNDLEFPQVVLKIE